MLLGTAIILQLMMRMMGLDETLFFLLLAWPFSRGLPRPRRVNYARLRDIWLGCDMSPFLMASMGQGQGTALRF